MNARQCFIQALRQAKVAADRLEEADAATAKWMAPYVQRDGTVDDGSGQVYVTDPETRAQVLKEVQLHPERPVKPYVFGPGEVKSLANHIRRELRLV